MSRTKHKSPSRTRRTGKPVGRQTPPDTTESPSPAKFASVPSSLDIDLTDHLDNSQRAAVEYDGG